MVLRNIKKSENNSFELHFAWELLYWPRGVLGHVLAENINIITRRKNQSCVTMCRYNTSMIKGTYLIESCRRVAISMLPTYCFIHGYGNNFWTYIRD